MKNKLRDIKKLASTKLKSVIGWLKPKRKTSKIGLTYYGFFASAIRRLKFEFKTYKSNRSVSQEMHHIFKKYPALMPDSNNYIFVHSSGLVDGNPVTTCKLIKSILVQAGYVQKDSFRYNDGYFEATFKKESRIPVFVAMYDSCEIESYEEVVKKHRVIGLCAKAIESINNT